MKHTQQQRLLASTSALVLAASIMANDAHAQAPGATSNAPATPVTLAANDLNTRTPIRHVIVIYGENRSFDHVFATYQPRNGGMVRNLLSQGIINADGTPGPAFSSAAQWQATDTDTYSIHPDKTALYDKLPPPSTDGTPSVASDTSPPPFSTISEAAKHDNGLLPRDLKYLTTGASGLPQNVPDTRITNVNNLPNGPYQLTGPSLPYDSYTGSPVHRFYQGWQESDCDAKNATVSNPGGCLSDLYPWVEETVSAGSNGKPPPPGFTSTGEGAISMAFYNMQKGDSPFFEALADAYTINDNYHMPAQGGTGLNSIFAIFADAIWYTDGQGNAATPPNNQVENPNPQPGTNNYYTQDGYSGGSYSACADTNQPGVGAVTSYLAQLTPPIAPNCEAGHYYLLNNYNPGYFGNGDVDTTDQFTIPPSPARSIGNVMLEHQVSFRWYGEGLAQYAANPNDPSNTYCNICNGFQYQTSIMTNQPVRDEVLRDTSDFYNDIRSGLLPAVSFVKPSGLNDGHPASSKWDLFEDFTKKILFELRRNPSLWSSTAVFITVDECGGYWDSGYIQQLDFFGDGPRIPLIVVSPYTKGGHVSHNYSDHVSILKFIEANWGLSTITGRSRDNLPNPVYASGESYVPTNRPSIGDLMDMFDFSSP
ncbi:MAG: hypothetical protein JOY71_15715 [Acetobacteraceae bacterium]|nr:hypothetical protein [Acetobacteraceae bacterium]